MVKVIEKGGKKFLWDQVRKQEVVYQPEEFQRQRLIQILNSRLDYPLSLFSIETGIEVTGMKKRFDVMVMGRDGMPLLLAECKSESIPLDQNALLQLNNYNRKIKAKILILFNGKELYCWVRNKKGEYQQQPDIPPFRDEN